MITLILGFIALAVLLYLFYVKTLGLGDYIGSTVVTVLVTGFLSLLFSTFPAEKPTEPYCLPIVQFTERDSQDINGGGSFLGWTITSGGPEYVVMQKEDRGSIRVFLNQGTTYIKETSESPYIEYPSHIEYWPKWRSMPWLWDNTQCYHNSRNAIVHVPTNTVIYKFNSL